MISKTVTYEDLDGNEVTETFEFHLNKLEAAELDLRYGGLDNAIKNLGVSPEATKVYNIFKDILLTSYGQRDSTNRRHVKTPEIRQYLEFSDALGVIIFEMLENPTLGAEFVKGILPKAAQEKIEEAERNGTFPVVELPASNTIKPVTPHTDELPVSNTIKPVESRTDEDILSADPRTLTQEELVRAFKLKTAQRAE